jgi:hypothetical protein
MATSKSSKGGESVGMGMQLFTIKIDQHLLPNSNKDGWATMDIPGNWHWTR